MSGFFMLATLLAYFFVLLCISRHATRKGASGNDAFFRAGRQSPWWMVAFGMIGASISGVTFISVPGWAKATGMTYLQMCMGFIVGYVVVAVVLLPLYYRLRLTSIYDYLNMRYGVKSHRTGALFFVLSKLTGAAARLYLVCMVLCEFVVSPYMGDGLVAFTATAAVVLALIWLYTRKSGIQTVVRTDFLQTFCLIFAAVGVLVIVAHRMGLDASGVWHTIATSPMCRIWEWDWTSKQAFWRQFVSGIFIVVVMTGLDQDMMQKNLTCRSLRDAQKDMCSYGLAFLPVNALFLALGILLYTYCASFSIADVRGGDALLPWLVSSGLLGEWVVIPFTIGIVAAAFSSADSAMTALTTTVCIDLLDLEKKKMPVSRARNIRRMVHVCVAAAFAICIIFFRVAGNDNILNAIYVMASYTYGPLLGLFFFGMFTRTEVRDRFVPHVCVLAPLVCAVLDYAVPRLWGYAFGYELLLLNGILTFGGLLLLRKKSFCEGTL